MNSLTRRLLTASLLVALLFALLTGVSLELAAVRNAELAEQDRLRGLVYGLLGAAEPVPGGGLDVADALLPEAELRQPDSGVEAVLWDADLQRSGSRRRCWRRRRRRSPGRRSANGDSGARSIRVPASRSGWCSA